MQKITASLVLALFFTFSANTWAVPSSPNSIRVEGQGELIVSPDIAYLSFAIETKEDSARESQVANAKIAQKVDRTLKKQFQIQSKDVQTTGFQVRAEYRWRKNNKKVLEGYRTTNRYTVGYRKLPDLGKLLDALSQVGVNQVDSIQFDTEKKKEYELKAIALAMKNARRKANVIAKAASRSVKKVLRVEQHDSWAQPPQPMMRGARMMYKTESAGSAAPISAGSLKVKTKVQVEYSM